MKLPFVRRSAPKDGSSVATTSQSELSCASTSDLSCASSASSRFILSPALDSHECVTNWQQELVSRTNEYCEMNGELRHGPDSMIAPFESTMKPLISFEDYVKGVVNSGVRGRLTETNQLKAAAVLMLRFAAKYPNMVTHLTVHRLFLICYLVAMKVVFDRILSNSHVAKMGGVCKRSLNYMEQKFLVVMDFDVNVTEGQFNAPLPFPALEAAKPKSASPLKRRLANALKFSS
eukprot:TRINITY_DN6259_c1_g1_i1.p1 TRINITY_DN6259_c1_g1~~TRINITY_DN6259_c1_g1_i1.p1  ORF type:complete len:250 (+),score=27.85 TRINITY_DN6259_c1_g1_i1:52-750(+)